MPDHQRPFAVFDIDGTLIRWQLYHAIADGLAKQGLLDNKSYEQLREARMQWKRRENTESFKAYENRLVVAFEQVIKNLNVEQFIQVAETVFEEYKDQVYAYTRGLIRELKKQNYLLFAISGSQNEIVEKIADYWGFDDFVGSIYERRGGSFTGEKTMPIGAKHIVLKKMVQKHGATWADSIAVGDSEGDISMLESVEKPIAFNPSKLLFDEASKHGWKIVVERKNVIYELRPSGETYQLISH